MAVEDGLQIVFPKNEEEDVVVGAPKDDEPPKIDAADGLLKDELVVAAVLKNEVEDRALVAPNMELESVDPKLGAVVAVPKGEAFPKNDEVVAGAPKDEVVEAVPKEVVEGVPKDEVVEGVPKVVEVPNAVVLVESPNIDIGEVVAAPKLAALPKKD